MTGLKVISSSVVYHVYIFPDVKYRCPGLISGLLRSSYTVLFAISEIVEGAEMGEYVQSLID